MSHQLEDRPYFRLTRKDLQRFRIDENGPNGGVSILFSIKGRKFEVLWDDLWSGVGTFQGLKSSQSWADRGEHSSTQIPRWRLKFERKST